MPHLHCSRYCLVFPFVWPGCFSGLFHPFTEFPEVVSFCFPDHVGYRHQHLFLLLPVLDLFRSVEELSNSTHILRSCPNKIHPLMTILAAQLVSYASVTTLLGPLITVFSSISLLMLALIYRSAILSLVWESQSILFSYFQVDLNIESDYSEIQCRGLI